MTVGPRYYTGTQNLIFKVMADAYDSDPDIYISRNEMYPTSSDNAEWFCEKDGSETCVLHNGDFTMGETLYFGILCQRECSYKLRVWYNDVIDISESSRT